MPNMSKSNVAPRLPLDLYQLRAFFAVAQTLNFTEAARRLCVPQPAVSHAVKKLLRSAGISRFSPKPAGSFTKPAKPFFMNWRKRKS